MSPENSATEVLDLRAGGSPVVDLPATDEPGRVVARERDREDGAGRRVWASVWPKLLAVGLVVLAWQVVVWSGWKPTYLLPGPVTVFRELVTEAGTSEFWQGIFWTLRRGLVG